MDKNRKGFSLVELLVALGVIAVLAGILLPVFAQVRGRARRVACLSNQRQLGLAMSLYVQDYDERYPDFRSDPQSAMFASDMPYWHDHFCLGLYLSADQPCFIHVLRTYLRSDQVAFCPADTDRVSGGRLVTSYEYKPWLANGRSLAEVPKPSAMANLWEQWAYHEGNGHLSEYDRRSAMNIVFVDGHAAWKRLADSSNSRFSGGPNLHGLFGEASPDTRYYGEDFP